MNRSIFSMLRHGKLPRTNFWARNTRPSGFQMELRRLHTEAYDGLVIGCYQGETPSLEQFGKTGFLVNDATHNAVFNQIENSHFKGKLGDHRTFFPIQVENIPPRITVVGLGKRPVSKLNAEDARRATAIGVNALKKVGATRIGIERLGQVSEHVIAEAATLALYTFDHLKKPNPLDNWVPTVHVLDPITSVIPSTTQPLLDTFESGRIYAEAQNLARTWMDTPANLMTPQVFAERVVERFNSLTSSATTSVQIHHEAWVQQHGMFSFHAVAKGSAEPLRFIEIKYLPLTNRPVHLALAGKGVTFDTGGISIKPAANMALMKGDMGGAAVVAAVMHGLAQLALPVNVVAFIPLCENMPSAKAVKPGDVIRAPNGLTIEIDNTDAEGRLLLADALCHAASYHPRCMIDVATLTGAIDVALGHVYSGVFTNSAALWTALEHASETTGDAVWRMPLNDVYLEWLQSDVADLCNAGKRSAGACTAAAFLKQFVPAHLPFAHLDIAGAMHYAKDTGALSKGMTGRPTRLLLEFLVQLSQQPALEALEKGTWECSH